MFPSLTAYAALRLWAPGGSPRLNDLPSPETSGYISYLRKKENHLQNVPDFLGIYILIFKRVHVHEFCVCVFLDFAPGSATNVENQNPP